MGKIFYDMHIYEVIGHSVITLIGNLENCSKFPMRDLSERVVFQRHLHGKVFLFIFLY